ncbi:hypothetical protein EDB83DRAFT_273773 [Lactarius deliciosus]|nr:hypothetical protein EDB83DRAFT_273773 [Lactarius deliciosus]
MLATCNNSGNSYTVSNSSRFNNCLCNSVAYNLLSVCDACQGQNWRAWSNYSSNCLNGLLPLFPNSVPLGTRVPQWALVDHTLEDNWNATKVGIDTPEIEPGSFAVSGSTSPTPSPLPRHFSSPSVNGPNTGTIRSQVPSAVVDDGAPPMSQQPPPLSAGDESDETYVPKKPVAPLKVYDPNDPRTFPKREPKREHADYSADHVYAGLSRPAYRLILGREETQLSFSRHELYSTKTEKHDCR